MLLLGVDPGTSQIGLALFDIDDRTFAIKNISTVNLDYRVPVHNFLPNGVIDRINNLYTDVYNFVVTKPIFWLAIEAGFISRFRMNAFGPISKSIYAIEKAFIDATGSYRITEFPPTVMKSVLKTKSGAKEDMLAAVLLIDELKSYVNINQTEHEIDAIAIGYSKLLDIRNFPECVIHTGHK